MSGAMAGVSGKYTISHNFGGPAVSANMRNMCLCLQEVYPCLCSSSPARCILRAILARDILLAPAALAAWRRRVSSPES